MIKVKIIIINEAIGIIPLPPRALVGVMNCHQDGEGGEGCFTVAGSVYDSLLVNPQPNGKLILTVNPASPTVPWFIVATDANGNFFTTENINWGDELYAILEGVSGDVRIMNETVTNGECNSCHGSSTDKIWVKLIHYQSFRFTRIFNLV